MTQSVETNKTVSYTNPLFHKFIKENNYRLTIDYTYDTSDFSILFLNDDMKQKFIEFENKH